MQLDDTSMYRQNNNINTNKIVQSTHNQIIHIRQKKYQEFKCSRSAWHSEELL